MPGDYLRAARGIDASLLPPDDAAVARARGAPPVPGAGAPATAPGSLEQALAASGGVRGVVFGWFGELSKSAVRLLRAAASSAVAQSEYRGDVCSSLDPERVEALYVSELWRDWGVEAARLRAEAVLALLPRPCPVSKLSSLELAREDDFRQSALDAARGSDVPLDRPPFSALSPDSLPPPA